MNIQQLDILIKQLTDKITVCEDAALLDTLITAHANLRARLGREPHVDTHKNIAPPIAVPCSSPSEIKIRQYPAINRAALKEHSAGLRFWYVMRSYDIVNQSGQGWMSRDIARKLLQSLPSWARARQILNKYNGMFWDISGDVIALRAPGRVAESLGIEKIRGKSVYSKPGDMTGSLKKAKATMYAVAVFGNGKGMPMSRRTIANIVNISPNTQIAYDKLANVRATKNIALSGHRWSDKEAREMLGWKKGRAVFPFTDHVGKFGKKGVSHIAYTIPNSYECDLEIAPKGRQNKHNQTIKLVQTSGPVADTETVRIYHPDDAKASRAFSRNSEHAHYWKGKTALQPNVSTRARFSSVGVWHALSLQGVRA